jgi:short-subunit dehydrogenase
MKKYVFITGATGGLGKAFASECASRGWNLFLTDMDKNKLSLLASGLQKSYDIKILYKDADLTSVSSRESLFEFISTEKLEFNFLINNAGIDFEGAFQMKNRNEIRTIIRLNIEATTEITHELLRLRCPDEKFHIINVSSLASYYPMPTKAVYASSKSFLLNFSFALREELRNFNCNVLALCPAGMPSNGQLIELINSQGVMGKLTTKNVSFIASKTLDHSIRNSAVYIPGSLNRLLKLLGAITPKTTLSHLINNRWKNTGKRLTERKCS